MTLRIARNQEGTVLHPEERTWQMTELHVWRKPNTAYAERNTFETVPFGGGSVMVWGCVSYDCKLDLITVRGTFNVQIYRQNILEASIVPHFDNHPLNTRPVLMDDNAKPHRTRCCDRLLAWRIDNHTYMACQEFWFKPDRAHLGHYRSSIERKNTVGSNFNWVKPDTAPGMVASYPSPNSSLLVGSMRFQSLMTLSEYKLCLHDGIFYSGINSFQVTFFFAKMTHF